ncbi:MAG: bifunctional hydroxymethylpyrimidine kinase/phosphomethylpyrimidine kinase [Chthoniobacterales bacterium]
MSLPIVLSIAGSDCSAGAGIQADLKTFGSFGCYGLTAVTCVVAEVPGRVRSIQEIRPEIVRDQIAILFEKFPIAAVKTGMLFSSSIIAAVAEVMGNLKKCPPFVVDPVMVATSGDLLLGPDALTSYRELLFPLATLMTPNLDELAVLARELPVSFEEMIVAGKQVMEETHCPLLLKGGHLRDKEATDILLMTSGEQHSFTAPFYYEAETHGTGCTYSAAIAAGLAKQLSLPQAVGIAKNFVTQAIAQGHRWGAIGALNQMLQVG